MRVTARLCTERGKASAVDGRPRVGHQGSDTAGRGSGRYRGCDSAGLEFAHHHPNPRRSALGYRRGAGPGAANANTAEPAAIADTGQLGSNPDAGATLGAGRPCRSGLSCSDSR